MWDISFIAEAETPWIQLIKISKLAQKENLALICTGIPKNY